MPADPDESSAVKTRGHLLRVLGVGFGLAVTIGGTIGMGILRTPGEVAARLPGSSLFLAVWVAGGIYSLLGAVSVAELATMIPRSGGWYVFAHRALGNYPGFVIGWSDWLSTSGTMALISMVIGEYTGVLFPELAGQTKSIALVIVLVFAALQWRGIRWGSLTQNLTSLLKALVFLILIAAAFTHGGKGEGSGHPFNAGSGAVIPHGLGFWLALVLALQGVLYTYDGWYGVIYFGEEVRNQKRDITASIFGGLLLVIVIYLLVNLSLLYVLPMSQLAGESLAVGAEARVIFGGYGDTVIRVIAILSMLSTVNAQLLIAPRILYAMSCDELFDRRGTTVNKGGTPTITLVISAVVAVIFILTGTFEKVLAVIAFFFVANYTMAYVSVFLLRWREPDLPRPYRAWGYPWTTSLALIGAIAYLGGAIAGDTRNSLRALGALAISYPVYLIVKLLAARSSRVEL